MDVRLVLALFIISSAASGSEQQFIDEVSRNTLDDDTYSDTQAGIEHFIRKITSIQENHKTVKTVDTQEYFHQIAPPSQTVDSNEYFGEIPLNRQKRSVTRDRTENVDDFVRRCDDVVFTNCIRKAPRHRVLTNKDMKIMAGDQVVTEPSVHGHQPAPPRSLPFFSDDQGNFYPIVPKNHPEIRLIDPAVEKSPLVSIFTPEDKKKLLQVYGVNEVGGKTFKPEREPISGHFVFDNNGHRIVEENATISENDTTKNDTDKNDTDKNDTDKNDTDKNDTEENDTEEDTTADDENKSSIVKRSVDNEDKNIEMPKTPVRAYISGRRELFPINTTTTYMERSPKNETTEHDKSINKTACPVCTDGTVGRKNSVERFVFRTPGKIEVSGGTKMGGIIKIEEIRGINQTVKAEVETNADETIEENTSEETNSEGNNNEEKYSEEKYSEENNSEENNSEENNSKKNSSEENNTGENNNEENNSEEKKFVAKITEMVYPEEIKLNITNKTSGLIILDEEDGLEKPKDILNNNGTQLKRKGNCTKTKTNVPKEVEESTTAKPQVTTSTPRRIGIKNSDEERAKLLGETGQNLKGYKSDLNKKRGVVTVSNGRALVPILTNNDRKKLLPEHQILVDEITTRPTPGPDYHDRKPPSMPFYQDPHFNFRMILPDRASKIDKNFPRVDYRIPNKTALPLIMSNNDRKKLLEQPKYTTPRPVYPQKDNSIIGSFARNKHGGYIPVNPEDKKPKPRYVTAPHYPQPVVDDDGHRVHKREVDDKTAEDMGQSIEDQSMEEELNQPRRRVMNKTPINDFIRFKRDIYGKTNFRYPIFGKRPESTPEYLAQSKARRPSPPPESAPFKFLQENGIIYYPDEEDNLTRVPRRTSTEGFLHPRQKYSGKGVRISYPRRVNTTVRVKDIRKNPERRIYGQVKLENQ